VLLHSMWLLHSTGEVTDKEANQTKVIALNENALQAKEDEQPGEDRDKLNECGAVVLQGAEGDAGGEGREGVRNPLKMLHTCIPCSESWPSFHTTGVRCTFINMSKPTLDMCWTVVTICSA
jgi:hypothetical protein